MDALKAEPRDVPVSSKFGDLSAFAFEETEVLKAATATIANVSQVMNRRLEQILTKAFEHHLGYVPSLEEAKHCGACGIFPDGKKEYKWKGVTILTIEAPNPSNFLEMRFHF